MTYPSNFQKFGPQSKSLSMKPYYFRPEWTNSKRLFRSIKVWGPSAVGFGVTAGLFAILQPNGNWYAKKSLFIMENTIIDGVNLI